MNELHRLTATEAVHGIRAGKIKAEDLVASCLNRISEREPLVGAWAFIDAEGALTHARELDRATTEDRLCGVPIAVKDMIDTGDMPTQYNSAIYRNYQPFADAACVALARRSGGGSAWQDCHYGVCLTLTWTYPQSASSPAHAWGFIQRFCGSGCRFHGAARIWYANRRFSHTAGCLLRRGWLQAELRYH